MRNVGYTLEQWRQRQLVAYKSKIDAALSAIVQNPNTGHTKHGLLVYPAGMTTAQYEFAICIEDEGYDDLEAWKVYRILPDPKAAEVGCLRVIDESGEDYLYPATRFVQVTFPEAVRNQLLATAGKEQV